MEFSFEVQFNCFGLVMQRLHLFKPSTPTLMICLFFAEGLVPSGKRVFTGWEILDYGNGLACR